MKQRFLILGAPGSGKGTYGRLLCKEYNLKLISSGDIFRKYNNKTKKLSKYLDHGKLIPFNIIKDVLNKEYLSINLNSYHGTLLDGIPRTIEQAKYLQSHKPNGIMDLVIQLQLDDQVIIEKLINRWSCDSCNEHYNLAHIVNDNYNLPAILPKVNNQCNICSKPLTQRKDDKKEIIVKRLNDYHINNQPIYQFYKENAKKFIEINTNQGIDTTFNKLLTLIG